MLGCGCSEQGACCSWGLGGRGGSPKQGATQSAGYRNISQSARTPCNHHATSANPQNGKFTRFSRVPALLRTRSIFSSSPQRLLKAVFKSPTTSMVLASSFLSLLSTTCLYNHFSPTPSNTTVLRLISHTLVPFRPKQSCYYIYYSY